MAKHRYQTLVPCRPAPRPNASISIYCQAMGYVDMVVGLTDGENPFSSVQGLWIVHAGVDRQIRADLALIAREISAKGWWAPKEDWTEFIIREGTFVGISVGSN